MRGQSHPLLRGRANRRPKTWFERGDGRARFARDRELVAALYPTLAYRVDDEAGRVYLEGLLIYRAGCGIPTEIDVRIEFPYDYPSREPRAFDAAGRFEHSVERHFSTKEGCCCLWLPPKSRWDPSDADALIPFLDEVVVFFDRQLVYDAGGKVEWPGPQYGHGAEGYEEWIVEEFGGDEAMVGLFIPVLDGRMRVGPNDKCPCDSRLKFKKCHSGVVERVRREVSPFILNGLFRPRMKSPRDSARLG